MTSILSSIFCYSSVQGWHTQWHHSLTPLHVPSYPTLQTHMRHSTANIQSISPCSQGPTIESWSVESPLQLTFPINTIDSVQYKMYCSNTYVWMYAVFTEPKVNLTQLRTCIRWPNSRTGTLFRTTHALHVRCWLLKKRSDWVQLWLHHWGWDSGVAV